LGTLLNCLAMAWLAEPGFTWGQYANSGIAMLGQGEELVDLGSHVSVLEAEDVYETQVPEWLLRLGHPDRADGR